MTSAELKSLLSAERFNIKKIEGWTNLTLEFNMKDGSTVSLSANETGLFFSDINAADSTVSEGILRIGSLGKASEPIRNDDGKILTITITEPIEYRYIIVDEVSSFAFKFDRKTITTVQLQTTTENTDNQ